MIALLMSCGSPGEDRRARPDEEGDLPSAAAPPDEIPQSHSGPESESESAAEDEAQPAGEEREAEAQPAASAEEGREPARIFARRFVAKIRERPDRDAFRIGYMRAGAVAQATTAEPVRTGDRRCRGGWYQLTSGGFVCNGTDVLAFWGRRPPEVRGAQPQRDAPLPYTYMRNRTERTPMYREVPDDEAAVQYEGFRIPGTEPEPAAEVVPGEIAVSDAAGGENAPAAPSPAADGASPVQPGGDGADDGADDEEGESEPVTLASLQGEEDSALWMRLVQGFIVSVDHDIRAGDYRRHYYRTIHNGFIPYRALGPISIPTFRGGRLDDTTALPIGYILSRRHSYYVATEGGRVRRGGPAQFQERLQIVDSVDIGNVTYFESADGNFYREADVRRIDAGTRPEGVGPHEKWIEVNLSQQYVMAYEGDHPVYLSLISSGRPHHPDDPTADFLTPTGLFRIRAKHLAANMDGDTAADGPYSIDDVPFVMYFQLAYALHGAFWHRAFGIPRSHGCVNLAPRDAQWVFNWSDPQLPDGWHGVYPTDERPGTWIYIHGDTPGA